LEKLSTTCRVFTAFDIDVDFSISALHVLLPFVNSLLKFLPRLFSPWTVGEHAWNDVNATPLN